MIHQCVAKAGIPVVYYVREEPTLHNLPLARLRPDLVVANSPAHAERASALGLRVVTIPSVVDFSECEVETSREVALFVNPVASRGLDIAESLATRRPDVRFAFQMSWPLRRRDRRALDHGLRTLSNVELRPYESDVRRVYRDAKVLLVPYRHDNRPRVIAESQWNGIPVLCTDVASHRESAGPGGVLVSLAAPVDEWARAFASVWDDPVAYGRLCAAARGHARRSDQDPEHLAADFESVTDRLMDTSNRARVQTP
jgi:glycosyltransferase involved in cell wall biosynthesis